MVSRSFYSTISTLLTFKFNRAILHDPKIYPSPDVFDPSRFVTEFGGATGVPDPYACFGYGRRLEFHSLH